MKNLQIIFLAFASVFSCDKIDRIEGMGPIVETIIEVDDFKGIESEIAATIHLTQGDEIELMAKGHQNIIDRLRTRVNNDRLNIDLENGSYKDFELTLYITIPDLNFLKVDGAGSFKASAFEVEKMRCEIDGTGSIDFESTLALTGDFRMDIDGSGDTYIQNLQANDVKVNVDGAGDITLRGVAKNLEVHIDGLGDVQAFVLECKTAEVYVNGLGKTEVMATEALEVDIDGIGNVYYKGEPTINKSIDGLGKLINAN